MKSLSWISLPIFAATILLAGCGGNDSASKASPKTMPDPTRIDNQEGYNDESYADYEEDYYDEKAPLELLTVHFEYDRYDLSQEAMDILSANAAALKNYPDAVIRVEGHCDERGTEEYNMALGEKRAQTVRTYLLDYGVDPKHISIISYGELKPVDRGQNEKAWRENRRANFVVLSE